VLWFVFIQLTHILILSAEYFVQCRNTDEGKLTMLCCWRLLATEAPRPKARQVAFSNCALKWTQARTRDNVAYELFLLVYVSETQASLPFGFPHFSWSYVWLLHFFFSISANVCMCSEA